MRGSAAVIRLEPCDLHPLSAFQETSVPDAGDRDLASGAASPVVQAAERLVARIEALVTQVAVLKADNAALRREVRAAVSLLERAGDAAVPPRATKRSAAPTLRHARGRRRGKGPKGRATPASVTPDIVLATIGKLGSATASEIAKELSVLGDQVSGRAVRWLAERAGAATSVGEDGQLRYRLPNSPPRS
jgi:hypothetical protein